MLYGIPPHMIGDTEKTTSWGTGIEQQSLGFVKFTLMPWLRTIEAAYSRVLLPRGQFMRFNLEGLLRADIKTRFESYGIARTNGWMSVNEIRALEDSDDIGPDGDTYIQQLNMAPLGSDPLAAKQQGGLPQ
jgi:HK97 family phage portal protein